jgi:hypothetical protein
MTDWNSVKASSQEVLLSFMFDAVARKTAEAWFWSSHELMGGACIRATLL